MTVKVLLELRLGPKWVSIVQQIFILFIRVPERRVAVGGRRQGVW